MSYRINVMEGNTTNSSALSVDDNTVPLTSMDLLINIGLFFVGLTIIVMNGIVITGFIKEKKVREAAGNVFIQNLATSDFFTGIFVCYVAVLNILDSHNAKEYHFRMGFICAFLVASAFFLNYLTIDRYLKVAMHLRYTALVTTRTHHILCIITWTVCVVLGFLPLMGWYNPNVTRLIFLEHYPSSYIIFNFTVGMIPALCMIVAYTKLYLISRQHRRRIEVQQSRDGPKKRELRKATEIMRSIFMLIGAYLFCWLPVGLYSLVGASIGRDPNQTSFPLFTVLVALGCMNSLLNPLIYAAKLEEIRDFFRKVCCRCNKIMEPVAFSKSSKNTEHLDSSCR